jgi:hypothetical protein
MEPRQVIAQWKAKRPGSTPGFCFLQPLGFEAGEESVIMYTFAKKPKSTQQTTSANHTRSDLAHVNQGREVSPIQHSQRRIENQAIQRLPQTHAEQREMSAVSIESARFGHDFSRIPVYPKARPEMQPKLKISHPGDRFEQEADRVADEVMRIPDMAVTEDASRWRESRIADAKEENVQTKTTASAAPVIDPVIEAKIHSLQSSGHPLPSAERAFFEPKFGHDFSQVRIHIGAQAEEAARALRARAFTTGWDIVFGSGPYTPEKASGRRLLAHELTHVAQQGQQNDLNARPFGGAPLNPTAQSESLSMTVQREPEEPTTEKVLAVDQSNQLDPLADEEAMEAVAREGARQLDAYMTNYLMGCKRAEQAITLSEAFATGRIPVFSKDYEATIATIRTQALAALHQSKGFLEGPDAKFMGAGGDAALEGINAAIAAISDGNDVVFIVDSRTAEGQTALAGIEHFEEQIAIRNRGFRDESGEPKRVSAGLSLHEGRIDPDRAEVTPQVEHRSVSILDIGALYDNRALADFVGPIQDQPGTLHIEMDTAAGVDLRAIFIHEVGGHALDIESPAEKETRTRGRLSESAEKAHEVRMENLVDNMVNKVAFLSFIRDDLPRELIRRLGE